MQKKLLKPTSVEWELLVLPPNPMDPVKGRKRIFPFGIMMCQDFCGRSKKEITSSKADQRGLCKEKFHSEEQPLPICQWIPATGQAPAFSTSSLQTQPIFDIYYSKWYFFNSLWAAWSVFWADDKSYLSCISASYPTTEDCSCQGSADSSCRMSQFATFRELTSFGGLFLFYLP